MGSFRILKPLLLLALVIALNHGASSVLAADLIHSTCEQLPRSDHHKFCIDSLEADPKSRKAKDEPELALAVTDLALANVTHTWSEIPLLEKRSELPHDPNLKSLLEKCYGLYSYALQEFRQASKFVEKKAYKDASTHLRRAASKPSGCETILSDAYGHVLRKENIDASQLALISEYIVSSLAKKSVV